MPRYRIHLEYDGSDYCGWQRQANCRGVQEALEVAILGFSKENIRVQGAGRTDAGVHATCQVAHFDLSHSWPLSKIRDAINAHLQLRKERIAVLEAFFVPDTFDARFSATKRHYVYRILNRAAPPALETMKMWWVRGKLDRLSMQKAASSLLGSHDFTTFRSVHCQAASPQRTLDQLEVVCCGDCIEIHVSARSFLHNQVRSLTGCLKRVGEGAWSPCDLTNALKARDRQACAAVAPAYGLYLSGVDYDGCDL